MAVYMCPECGHQYDETKGDKREGFPAGTRWSEIPADFACPGCAVRMRDDFVMHAASGSEANASALSHNGR